MATTQPRGTGYITLRILARNLMGFSDSPLRGLDLHISVPTDDDPSDFLEDLTAAIQGIKI